MKVIPKNSRIVILAILLTSFLAGSNSVASTWWETIKLKGDLRYRHEMIDREGKNKRNRQRIRVRIGLSADVSAYSKVSVQLASGSDDPVSTNQTCDDAGSTKPIGLDLAYFRTSHGCLPGFQLIAGKMKNPFFKPGKSELIWDSDWNPEGGAATFAKESGTFDLTLIGAGFWIDERSSSDESYLAAGQAVGRLHFNERKSSVALGGSIFNYVNTQGYEPFYDHEDPMGNSTVPFVDDGDTVLHYANDYELLELFGEVTHKFNSTPVTVMWDYVTNIAADSLNAGWLFGVRVGKTKKSGSWQFQYLYKQVEQDAVIGVLTDSDFIGGGTDGKGHEIGGAVQLATNTSLQFTYFINKIGINAASPVDFNRLQADVQLKF
ncbi:MAG: putative porin [candidate division Zixibacteria bacterium]|nr:putative porin [candidate division Zixibacteria bacterium]